MKRVVLIRSNSISPDPPVEKMANALLELGYCVTILGWDREYNYKIKTKVLEFKNGKAELILFGIKATFGAGLKGNLKPLILFQLRIRKWLNDNFDKIDILHAFDFDTGYIAKKSIKSNIKFIYHILDYYIDSHKLSGYIGHIIRAKENRIINSADATIICTEKRKEQIVGTTPKKLYVIHNTPDINIIKSNLTILKKNNDSKIKIVYVGILVESRLLKEISRYVINDSRFEFHVGGFGKLEKYFEENSKIYQNIYYYGKLPYDQTLALEKDCDIMVAIYDPTIKNNKYAAPNKFYEALMIGKPLIMAKGTGFDDIIDNNIGCTIDFSSEGIKEGLKFMIANKASWPEMSNKSKRIYKDYYSWDIMKKRIKELYSNL